MRRTLQAITLSACIAMSSCAYMQTHKNVEEWGSYYEGEHFSTGAMALYKYQGQWYISAHRARFKLKHPIIFDSVFQKYEQSPTLKLTELKTDHMVYHPISSSAAEILQRSDGFFQLRALADEVQRTPGSWVDSLPGAQRYPVRAEIGDGGQFNMQRYRVPEKTPTASYIAGKIDFILVDVPGTVVYNVAIPLMAPFVFFYEFISGD